jgi:signal transduction histidine kinase/DNA-binding response OmpR family regulator
LDAELNRETLSRPGPEAELDRELAYYKRQVDTLAGENLKLEYVIAGLRYELKQKRQGFALLSRLHESIGVHTNNAELFAAVLPAINATVAMDKTVVLIPVAGENRRFRVLQSVGYAKEEIDRLAEVELDLPTGFASGTDRLLANRAAMTLPVLANIAATLALPFFVGVPVVVQGHPIALIISGRQLESKPFYPPLDQGDLDTFVAIAELISASVRNMRVGVLEKLDKMKTEFFANLSHEFRTPITLTLGPLEQLLSGRSGELNELVKEQLRLMQRNQSRLLSLVNQILDLAKLEAGRMALRPVATPQINRLISGVASQFHAVAEQRGLELRLQLSPDADVSDLFIDREKVERVVWNLLSNALKFTRTGVISVTTARDDDAIALTVSDTGVGIREDQVPYIFDRFRQADGSETREFAGSGIGLSLVKEIAELHGGRVIVESRYGIGTSFTVTFPIGNAHLDPASLGESNETSDGAGMRAITGEVAVLEEGAADSAAVDEVRRANEAAEASFDSTLSTILYAEDNPDLRRHVRGLLGTTYNIFLAVDGRDALEKVRRYRPDLVLSDHMMPGMTGRDLLNALRADAETRETPVIFLTARAGVEARVESLEAGVDDYITKPFSEGELLARIRNVLRARAQERELAKLNQRLEARVEEQLAELVRGGELLRFLPATLVDTVMSGRLEVGKDSGKTERAKITVLSTEVTGLVELTEVLEPEELAGVMNEFFREMSAAAVERGGTVDRMTANGVTILFGAPTPTTPVDQAIAAARTALAMRERLRQIGTSWRRHGVDQALEMRAGIQTGFCTVGIFGTEVLRNYTAVGGPVMLASALREDAPPGCIVCGSATQALLEGATDIVLQSRGSRELGGVARPVLSFEIGPSAGPEDAAPFPRQREFFFMPR